MTYQSSMWVVIAVLFIVAIGSMVLLVSESDAGASGGGETQFPSDDAPPLAVKQTDEGFVPVSEDEMSTGTLEDATRELQP